MSVDESSLFYTKPIKIHFDTNCKSHTRGRKNKFTSHIYKQIISEKIHPTLNIPLSKYIAMQIIVNITHVCCIGERCRQTLTNCLCLKPQNSDQKYVIPIQLDDTLHCCLKPMQFDLVRWQFLIRIKQRCDYENLNRSECLTLGDSQQPKEG